MTYSPETGIPPEANYHDPTRAIIETVNSIEVHELVFAGRATLGMIRPNIEGSVRRTLIPEGANAVEVLERNIRDLQIHTKFDVQFDDQAVHEFYAGPSQESQRRRPPEKNHGHSNRWDEFVSIMTGGLATAYLLVSPSGDAVDRWRGQVGHWDIENRADPSTLRGRFGVHNYNNLLHGSDSPQEVHRELGVIASCLRRTYAAE